MRYHNEISYAILLDIAYDIKDIANAIKKISHEMSLRYRNDAISHAISHLTRIQMKSNRLSELRFRTHAMLSTLSGDIVPCTVTWTGIVFKVKYYMIVASSDLFC